MTPERFSELLAAYGADPRRWPAVERSAAVREIARAGPALAEATALDRILAQSATPSVSAALRRSVLARLQAQPASNHLREASVTRWRLAAGLGAACACGALSALVVVSDLTLRHYEAVTFVAFQPFDEATRVSQALEDLG